MLSSIISVLQAKWKLLLLADVLYKLLAYIVLVPLVSLLFRCFLTFSGRDILADVEIAKFFLHPLGWLSAVIVGGGVVGVTTLEIGTLMTIALGARSGEDIDALTSLKFVFERASRIFLLASRIVGILCVVSLPFLAVGAGLYFIFLTDHDINFYLANKPPKFLIVAGSIGVVLAAMVTAIVGCLANWAIAIPLALFEGFAPKDCLRVSQERLHGQHLKIGEWIAGWAIANFVIGSVASAGIYWLGRSVVPRETNSVLFLVTVLGMVLSVWAIVHFLTQMLSTISFALVLAYVYEKLGTEADVLFPTEASSTQKWPQRLTFPRIIAAVLVSSLIASSIGMIAVHTVQFQDQVQITAHRGASAKAPENTLAAVRQAIVDKTDWVEIDVQESSDGVVVVAHDSDLKRVSGEDVKIWEATAEELRTIDIGSYFHSRFRDERVPTLAEVLQECRGKTQLNIELKYYGHDQDLERKVVALVEQFEMADDVVIMSLKEAGIQKVKSLRPDWTVGLLTAVAASDLTRAKADFLAVSTKLATRSFIAAAHQRGKQVYVWTVNDAATMSSMIGRGADNLITDRPDLARSVLEERLQMSPLERILVEFSYLFGAPPGHAIEQ